MIIPVALAVTAVGIALWAVYQLGHQKSVAINHAFQIVELHERIDVLESLMEKMQTTHEALVAQAKKGAEAKPVPKA